MTKKHCQPRLQDHPVAGILKMLSEADNHRLNRQACQASSNRFSNEYQPLPDEHRTVADGSFTLAWPGKLGFDRM